MTILQYLYKLIEPKSKDEDLKRREFILNILLLSSIILLIAANIFVLLALAKFGPVYQEGKGLSPQFVFLVLLIFSILYLFSRAGFFVITAYIFILVYFIANTYYIYKWGAELPIASLFYALIIIMSGILISTRFAFIITLLSSITILSVSYLQINSIINPNLYWKKEMINMEDMVAFTLVFAIIATVVWLSNREIERSLKRARRSEAELKKERDSLEIKVEQRTKELKKLQMERMSQLYRFAEFGRLSSGLFHDLMNPLTSLFLNLKQVKDSKQKEITEAKSNLERAVITTKRMENFIIATQKQICQQATKTNFSLFEEINQAIQILAYKARQAGVQIVFLPSQHIKTYGDSVKFNQIVTNLVSNAIDAYENIDKNRKKREIHIELFKENNAINLFVEDWASGISQEHLGQIFEPFFTTKGAEKGVGIGLLTVKKIVEKDFEGSIEVVSQEGQGTKFMLKLSTQDKDKDKMNKINQLIDQGVTFLAQQQQTNGSFLDLVNDHQYYSILSTALILAHLNGLKETSQIKTIKQKAAEFLLSQKSKDWSFNYWPRHSAESKLLPDNLNVTFCALCALNSYNPGLIDGSAMAKILMLLTKAEEKEGGPYYSFISKKTKDNLEINLATNIHIACFLSLQDVSLPELDKLIESTIETKNFNSSFYPSDYLNICCLSQFYQNKKEQIIDYLISKQDENGQWDNPLNTTLAVSSLINLNLPLNKLETSIRYLTNSQIAIWQKPYPTYINFDPKNKQLISLGSAALTTAFWLKILSVIAEKLKPLTINKELARQAKKEQIVYKQISQLAEQRFSCLEKDIKEQTLKALAKTIKADQDKQIVLLPHFFKNALGQKGKGVSDQMIIQLGLANLYLWMAYTIYDDFLDEEGDPKLIATANLCLREFTSIFNRLIPLESQFHTFFGQIMDRLEAANTWETVHCRILVSKTKLYLPENIPDYNNFNQLCERSLAHALGPVAILFSLGYTANSVEVKNLMSFFKHYLIARQLNDDAHDWEQDLKNGQINSVVAEIFKKLDKQTIIDLENDISQLQEKFWFKMINDISNQVLEHVASAKKSLKAMTILADPSLLEKFLLPAENAAKKAIKEQNQTIQFLETYQGE